MKAWYDDIDGATLQRIKTYSAFNDYKSKNWMLQTLYEAIVTKYEKETEELKKELEGVKDDGVGKANERESETDTAKS